MDNDIDFDTAKNESNFEKHGLWFQDVRTLNWDHALFKVDSRKEYGETRISAFLFGLDEKPYNVVFTQRDGRTRIISFRRARVRERKYYNEERS